jgi:hypothetical protein
VVERRNQSVMNATRCMMKVKKLPSMFWGEVVNCVVYLLNRTTSRSTGDCTPYELWTGSKANVSHLRVFGCIAHVKTTAPNLKKLDDRIKPMILLVMNQDQLLIDAMIQTPNMFTSAGTSYLMKKGSGIGHRHK